MNFEEFARRSEDLLSVHAEVAIRRARRANSTDSPKTVADNFVLSLGFTPLGDRWFDLDLFPLPENTDANDHLAGMLRKDMIHSDYEWLSRSEADACARGFYSYFQEGPSVRLANRVGNGWIRITQATCEAAYVAIDNLHVGLFLLQAED